MHCSLPRSPVHGFSRQEYWNGLLYPSPRDLPKQGIKPSSSMSPALAGSTLRLEPPRKHCLSGGGLAAKSCLTLVIHKPARLLFSGISQARMLEWIAIPFSRGSSQPRGRTHVACIAGRFFILTEPPGTPKSVVSS